MSFSVEDLKTALYTQAKWLPNDGKFDLDLSYDSGTYERVAQFITNGTIRSENIDLDGRQFSRINVTYVLGRDPGDVTSGAVLTRCVDS